MPDGVILRVPPPSLFGKEHALCDDALLLFCNVSKQGYEVIENWELHLWVRVFDGGHQI